MGVLAVRQRAVFLDRDGVINRAVVRQGKPYPPASLEDLEILPGVAQALTCLQFAGYHLIVVTNQPDVARGKQSIETVEEIHSQLKSQLPIDEFQVCYHDDEDGCSCRKPAPGLLLAAAERHGIELSSSYMIGDRWRDIEAGHRAGCRTILIDHHYHETRFSQPDICFDSLASAVDWILLQTKGGESHGINH